MQTNAEAVAAVETTLDELDRAIAAVAAGAPATFNAVAARAAVKLCKAAPADARREAKRVIDAAVRRTSDGRALAAARSAIGAVAAYEDAAAVAADDAALPDADDYSTDDAAALAAISPQIQTEW